MASGREYPEAETARITHLSWGRMEVQIGVRLLRFKDCKLWTRAAVDWDWTLTGTHHRPGIQPDDIAEILAQGIEIMILSRGMQRRLETSPATEDLLQAREIPYHILDTKEAVEMYNRLAREGKKVGGIFHSTC